LFLLANTKCGEKMLNVMAYSSKTWSASARPYNDCPPAYLYTLYSMLLLQCLDLFEKSGRQTGARACPFVANSQERIVVAESYQAWPAAALSMAEPLLKDLLKLRRYFRPPEGVTIPSHETLIRAKNSTHVLAATDFAGLGAY
jgi:hypothetical protein